MKGLAGRVVVVGSGRVEDDSAQRRSGMIVGRGGALALDVIFGDVGHSGKYLN